MVAVACSERGDQREERIGSNDEEVDREIRALRQKKRDVRRPEFPIDTPEFPTQPSMHYRVPLHRLVHFGAVRRAEQAVLQPLREVLRERKTPRTTSVISVARQSRRRDRRNGCDLDSSVFGSERVGKSETNHCAMAEGTTTAMRPVPITRRNVVWAVEESVSVWGRMSGGAMNMHIEENRRSRQSS
jgi:hypothetical protein